jgi:hypothetical protein
MDYRKKAVLCVMALIMALMPAAITGCEEEVTETETPPAPTQSGMDLSSTLVPNADFDIYVYIRQESPTTILKDIIGTPFDVTADSMSLWGTAAEDTYTLAGGVAFTASTNAADVHEQIPESSDIWTILSDYRIYFVHGSGTTVENMRSAIAANDFKNYDDQEALAELALYPDGATTKLIGVAVARPNQTLAELVAKYTVPATSDLLNVLLKTANVEVITAGFYSAHQLDVAEIAGNPEFASIMATGVGILAAIKSAWPGILFNPVVEGALGAAGYQETSLGDITIYKGILDVDGDEIPLLFRVEDNRLYAALAVQESYAEALINGIDVP